MFNRYLYIVIDRMKLSFVVLLACGWSCVAAAVQHGTADQYNDSLLRLIAGTTDVNTKFTHYLDLSLYWSDLDTAKAYQYLSQAERLNRNPPDPFKEGLLIQYAANILFAHDAEQAKRDYRRADSLLATVQSQKSYRYRSKLWNNYALLLQLSDSSVRHMDIIIDKVIPLAKQAGDSLAVGYALTNIGLAMMNANDYPKAEQYYKQAVDALQHVPQSEEGQLTVQVLAARNAMFLRQFDQARVHLDEAARVFQRIPHSLYAASYYRTQGTYYRHIKNRDLAEQMFERALELARIGNRKQLLSDIYFEKYALNRDFGDFSSAKEELILANQYGEGSGLQDQLLHIREMARTEKQLGDFQQSSLLFERYSELSDSLYGRNYRLKLAELEKQYHSLEKENRILELAAANQEHQLSLGRTKRWLIITLSALAIALISVYFFRKLAHHRKRLLVQNDALHEKQIEVRHTHKKLEHFEIVLQAQEEERNRVARDLHDGLGGLLAGLKLKLSSFSPERNIEIEAPEVIDQAMDDLDRATDELRRIARNLIPEALMSMGLSAALADLCHYLGQGGTKINYQSLGISDDYPKEMSIGIFRIVTEVLNNALKHAEAHQIIVQCEEMDQRFHLTIEDDGVGFDIQSAIEGLGLISVQNRVAVLNGQFEMVSHQEEGTTVNVNIPIPLTD